MTFPASSDPWLDLIIALTELQRRGVLVASLCYLLLNQVPMHRPQVKQQLLNLVKREYGEVDEHTEGLAGLA